MENIGARPFTMIVNGVLIDEATLAYAQRTVADTLRTLMGAAAAEPYVRAVTKALNGESADHHQPGAPGVR